MDDRVVDDPTRQKTRQALIQRYRVDKNGVVRAPGKFEAEMLYVPYLWARVPDDTIDDTDDGLQIYVYTIDDEERTTFPELDGVEEVRLVEREDGFVIEVEVEP